MRTPGGTDGPVGLFPGHLTDPLFTGPGAIPVLGETLGNLLDGVVDTVVPAYQYTASCSWQGSYDFTISGFAAGLDVAEQTFVTYEGQGAAPVGPASAQVASAPAELVGTRFVAAGATAPKNVTKKVRTGTRTVYSGYKSKSAKQKLVVRRR